jgi:hypothetical protein
MSFVSIICTVAMGVALNLRMIVYVKSKLTHNNQDFSCMKPDELLNFTPVSFWNWNKNKSRE